MCSPVVAEQAYRLVSEQAGVRKFDKVSIRPKGLFLRRISTGSVMKCLRVIHGIDTTYACAPRGKVSETQDGNASGRMQDANMLMQGVGASIIGKPKKFCYIEMSSAHQAT